MRSVALHTCVSESTTKIWMKIDLYYQRQKCSPGIAVSSSKIYADIRRGSLARGLQMRVGSSKIAIFAYFTRHIFRTFTSKATIIILSCSPIVPLQWHRTRWPGMTLNAHFALKSVWGSATNELAFLAFGQNCSQIWRATYILSATRL